MPICRSSKLAVMPAQPGPQSTARSAPAKSSAFFKQRLMMHGFSCMLRAGHPAARRLTKTMFSELEQVVDAPTRSLELVDKYLDRRHIFRKVRLRTMHYLTLPVAVASTDLVATVPSAVGRVFADLGQIVLVEPPFDIPKFPDDSAGISFRHRQRERSSWWTPGRRTSPGISGFRACEFECDSSVSSSPWSTTKSEASSGSAVRRSAS